MVPPGVERCSEAWSACCAEAQDTATGVAQRACLGRVVVQGDPSKVLGD